MFLKKSSILAITFLVTVILVGGCGSPTTTTSSIPSKVSTDIQ